MEKILIALMASYYFYIVGLMIYGFKTKKAAVAQKAIDPRYFKTYKGEAPTNVKTIENHINNQFELPIIFYIVCVLALQQQAVTIFTLLLAVTFIISRLFHSCVHLGSNNVLKRAYVYMSGLVILGIMFLYILVANL